MASLSFSAKRSGGYFPSPLEDEKQLQHTPIAIKRVVAWIWGGKWWGGKKVFVEVEGGEGRKKKLDFGFQNAPFV